MGFCEKPLLKNPPKNPILPNKQRSELLTGVVEKLGLYFSVNVKCELGNLISEIIELHWPIFLKWGLKIPLKNPL